MKFSLWRSPGLSSSVFFWAALVLIGTGIYLYIFQNDLMNQIFGMQICGYPTNYNSTVNPGADCSPPAYVTYWNPVGGALVFEGFLVLFFLWLRQSAFGKRHPGEISYASLAFISWLVTLVIIFFRLDSLSGNPQPDFSMDYLPTYVSFYLSGAAVFYIFFLHRKKYGSIEEIKAILWLWIVLASFTLLLILGVFEPPVQPLSENTIVVTLVFLSSVTPFVYLFVVKKGEFSKMQDASNVAPAINFCGRCGTALLRGNYPCSKCGLDPYANPIKASIKKNSLFNIITPLSLPLLYTLFVFPGYIHLTLDLPLILIALGMVISYIIFLLLVAVRAWSGTLIHIAANSVTINEIRTLHLLHYLDPKGRENVISFKRADRIRSKPTIRLKVSRYTSYDLTFYSAQELISAATMFFESQMIAQS